MCEHCGRRRLMKMFLPYCLVILAVGFAAASPLGDEHTKIVGGEETTIEDVPYQLQMENAFLGILWSFACGGVIVGQDIVLTAGHCVEGNRAQDMRFRSGNKNRGSGPLHEVSDFILHPNYTDLGGYADNDVAVLKVTPPFEFSNSTQAIPLVEVQPSAGDNATVSGWGTTSETSSSPAPIVRKVVVPVIDQSVCVGQYEGVATVTETMICAGVPEGGKDSCSGDSGGPFIVDGKVAGLVSWGNGCAEADYPGVYTNVVKFLPWIQEQINRFSTKH